MVSRMEKTMSLSAIQDNLVKVNLVQQTQTRGDDVTRSQEIFQTAMQREQDRQGDQVVLMTHQTEQEGIRADEEREKEEQKKKKKREEEEEERAAQAADTAENGDAPSDARPRAAMHRINIVI